MSEETPPQGEEEGPRLPPVIEVPGLVFELIEASMANTHNATNALIDSLERTIIELRGELRAVRERIIPLCDMPYAPNPARIEAALWPSRDLIERCSPPDPFTLDWGIS